MEWPGAWTALIASLSVADLNDPPRTWRFLRAGELVVDSTQGVEVLSKAIATERARGRITGGSFAHRVAGHIVENRLAGPNASNTDPFGKLAKLRWNAFDTAESV